MRIFLLICIGESEMIRVNQRRWYLVLCFVLTIVIMHLSVVYTYFYHDITGAPKAVNGSINLSSVNPGDGKIYLDGEWEFHWSRFIMTEPEQLSRPDLMAAVPDSWSKNEIDGKRLPAGGYGSYKLTLTDLIYDNPVTICIPDLGGAYRVFIDGQLASKSGTISKNKDGIFTVPKADLYPVTLSGGTTHKVIIEVSTTRFSGLYMTPVLSDYHQMIHKNVVRNEVRFFLFGIVVYLFLNLIAMYLMSVRRKFYSFWLPIMILFFMMRIMLTTEFYSFWQPILFFNLSYESTNELMYLSTFVLKYLLIFLAQEQCGITFTKREKLGFLVYYALLFFTYRLTPQSIYNQYLSLLVPMLTYVLDIYLFIKVYRDWQSMKRFEMVMFWGVTFVIAGLAIDSYYINGKIYMNMSLVLLLFFTVSAFNLSWVYAMRLGDLYDDFSNSSLRLKLANNQIAMQKEYYDMLSAQMNEIREMKHDIRHFTRVMNQLMNENKFDELRMFLGDYIVKTDMEQLPIFCENVVSNSIIGYHYLSAKESGISFESMCNIGKCFFMSDSDICIVIGNALENAVYACKKMEDCESRFVSIEVATMKRQWLIKVKNSYNGCLEIKDGRYISSKGDKSHGLGIQNIKKVVESYGGFVQIEHNEKEFTLMIAIPEN